MLDDVMEKEPLHDPAPSLEAGGLEQPQRQLRRVVLFSLLGIVLLAMLMAWLTRKQIAESIISNQLKQLNLPATYKVDSIGAKREVLSNVVVGDPQNPDLTVERVVVTVVPRWGMPDLGRITLVKPRLYARYVGGKFSFGSLDKVLFTGSKQPFRLPDLDVAIEDGRGRLESDFGQVGLKIDGSGALRNGFAGTLAAIMPSLAAGECQAGRTSLYGALTVSNEKPRFQGPVRLASLKCAKQALKLAEAGMKIDTVIDQSLDGAEGKFSFAAKRLVASSGKLASSEIEGSFSLRKQALTARYAFAGKGFAMPQAQLAGLGSNGVLRTQDNFARIELEGDLEGTGLQMGDWLDGSIANIQRSSEGTLAAPLIAQLRSALTRETRSSRIAGNFIARQTGTITNLVVPQAALRGGAGASLLTLSRFQMTTGGSVAARIGGNFTTGGSGMPRIAGTIERAAAGGFTLRAAMANYAAGQARLALPELVLVQDRRGALGFAGSARLSGTLPGGVAQNLALPIEGNWTAELGLAMWRKCVPLRYDSLTLANLTLQSGQRRGLTLCPAPGQPILAMDGRGVRLAAGAGLLDVAGKLGATPIRLRSGAFGFAYPGLLSTRALDVTLGADTSASQFQIANLTARLGRDIAGKFAGTDVKLAAVPLDLLGAEGDWRYADGKLLLSNAVFRLEDRQLADRFEPLIASGAELQLANNVITAAASLREPKSGIAVARTAVRHSLTGGIGSADLFVDQLTFDNRLQPDQITYLTKGLIAYTNGSIGGSGRIDWTPTDLTSHGRFSTQSLDVATTFGPAKGLAGTIEFTDLLGLVTAPNQRLKIASINPGIEVYDGELSYEIRSGNLLVINGAEWPFLGGQLTLAPSQMQMGSTEVRNFTLGIEALDAAKFLQKIEAGNILATGVFDGQLPLVFDQDGGRIIGGQLISRAPGGNVSYVGELTYKDMGMMANFAFDALKSLDYRRMQIDLNGALTGELVTRVSFDGISQGRGARRNFLTRQVARLPLQFNVNLRAPFFKLVTSLRSLYDPNYVADPRALGLLGSDGKAIPRSPVPANSVQPSVSEPNP